jgi:glycosyltransferase involved in cell wall biosynthesis
VVSDLLLSAEVKGALASIRQADVLVGIPSYNNASTIGHVVRAVNAGLAKYFPDQRCIIVNSDGGSRDGTPEVVLQAQIQDYQTILVRHPLQPIHRISTAYHGIPGKGSAFRTIFRIAEELNVSACAVLDSDLRSITPEWVELLIRPVISGDFDYVSPFYLRHKFDGTITNSIVHPLTRALYGKRIRQPIGGDFGFSGKLASFYLKQDVWKSDVARFGIDIWMTTTAICEGFRVCQVFLGAKIHDPKDPGSDLSAMMMQVVGSVFDLMETYHSRWVSVRSSEPVPLFGFQFEVGLDPVPVNIDRMVDHYRQGLADLTEVWEMLMTPDNMRWLRSIAANAGDGFRFPDELWVKVIYDFAVAYHKRVISPDHIIRSMTPLYMGRVASFVADNIAATAAEVEEKIEQLGLSFEKFKPYLLERW